MLSIISDSYFIPNLFHVNERHDSKYTKGKLKFTFGVV